MLLRFTLLIAILSLGSLSFGQNLIVNGDFEEPGMAADAVPAPWGGFKNRIRIDTVSNSYVGQIENGDGSLFQEFAVAEGDTFKVEFDYKWVDSGAANRTLNVRIKDANDLPNNLDLIGGTTANGFLLDTTVNEWITDATFNFTPPAGITAVRLLFFKANGNKTLNLDNVSVTLVEADTTSSVANLRAYGFSAFPNPAQDIVNLSAAQNIDKVELYSLTGQRVRTQTTASRRVQVDLSGLPQGIYIVRTYIDGTVGSYRLVKE